MVRTVVVVDVDVLLVLVDVVDVLVVVVVVVVAGGSVAGAATPQRSKPGMAKSEQLSTVSQKQRPSFAPTPRVIPLSILQEESALASR